MKIRPLLTNEDITSFNKIEKIQLFVYFTGLNKSGKSIELIRSHFDIEPSRDGKYRVYTLYVDDYTDAIKNLNVTEIELSADVTGSLNPEYVKTTLDSYLDKHIEQDPDAICSLFESKINEVFYRNLGKDVYIANTKIRKYRGMFQDRNIESKVKFETTLNYSKKVIKFL